MSTISAGVTVPTGITLSSDTTGALTFQVSGTVTAASISATGNLSLAIGNLTFAGTGQRITGDFTNSTASSRLLLQSSTTNGLTTVGIIPNGTSTTSALVVNNASDASNASFLQLLAVAAETRINSSYVGTGSYLPLAIYTGGSERMRIDSSGNVGIGTNNPLRRLDIAGGGLAFTESGGASRSIHWGDTTNIYPILISGTATTGNCFLTFNTNTFGSAATERMRITSGGLVGIGTASPNVGLEVVSAASENSRSLRVAYDTTYYYEIRNLGAAGNRIRSNNGSMTFNITGTDYAVLTTGGEFITGGTTDQGAYNLQCNGTGVWGAGAYVNGSDARLKDNIQSLDSGLDVVKAMRPVTFQYKPEYSKDQSVQPGFIAQELQQAMAGKNYLDGVVQSGPEYLNVAYQNIIPILVKAIQELEAKIAALESK